MPINISAPDVYLAYWNLALFGFGVWGGVVLILLFLIWRK